MMRRSSARLAALDPKASAFSKATSERGRIAVMERLRIGNCGWEGRIASNQSSTSVWVAARISKPSGPTL
jgi:hypothetical protein